MISDRKNDFYNILNYNENNLIDIDIPNAVLYYFNNASDEEKNTFLKEFPIFAKAYLDKKLLPGVSYFPYSNIYSYMKSFLSYEIANINKDKSVDIKIFPKKILDVYFCISHLYTDYDYFIPNFVKNRKIDIETARKRLNIGIDEYINYANERPGLIKRNEFIDLLRKNKVAIETNRVKRILDEKYKDFDKKSLQEAYTVFVSSSSNIDNYLSKMNFSYDKVEEMAKAYCLLHLNGDLAIWQGKVKKRLYFGNSDDIKYIKIIKEFEESKDVLEQKRIVQGFKNISNYFWTYINRCKNHLSYEEKKELEEKLCLKLKQTRELINVEKKNKTAVRNDNYRKDKILSIMDKIDFNLFLASNVNSVEEFCEIFDLSKTKFHSCLAYLIETNNPLGEQISKKIEKIDLVEKQKEEAMVNNIKDKIINGIETEFGIRNFDVLDYFLITNYSFEKFSKIAMNYLSIDDYTKVRTFFNNQKLGGLTSADSQKNITTILKVNDEMYQVTDDDIDNTFMFLNDNNVSLYTKVYKIALKRYLNGSLPIVNDKVYKK